MNSITKTGSIPPGPVEPFDPEDDLLSWMQLNSRTYGDVYKASIYGGNVYVISSPEYAEYVLLKNWSNFLRKGPAVKRIALSLGNGLISSNGQFWVRQRRMIQPAFARGSISAFFDVFVQANVELREKWKHAARQGASVDVTRDVSLTVLEVTLRSIFGDAYDTVFKHFEIIAEESRNIEFAQTCKVLLHLIVDIVEQRRAVGIEGNDVLGMMMRSRDRDSGAQMAASQLARECLTLVIAGHETTASVLNWIWYLLARHPQVEAGILSEMHERLGGRAPKFATLGDFNYMRQVIEEALRSYPPLWLMTRKTLKPDQIGEYMVPAGTEIYISPYLLQHHPRLWRDSEQFDPGRFDPAHLGSEDMQDPHRLAMCPFGAGPRNCIGEVFARVEMQTHLLTIVSELQLQYDDSKPAEFVAGVNLLSRGHFIMRPVLRSPGPGFRDRS